MWNDKGKDFYNRNLKEVLDKRNVKLYSTENKEKSSVVERWNRTIKTKMCKQFTEQNLTQYAKILSDIIDKNNKVSFCEQDHEDGFSFHGAWMC